MLTESRDPGRKKKFFEPVLVRLDLFLTFVCLLPHPAGERREEEAETRQEVLVHVAGDCVRRREDRPRGRVLERNSQKQARYSHTLTNSTYSVNFFVFKPVSFSKNRYESVVIGNGLANQVSNPDVDVDITKPDVVIRSQIAVLKEMTSWLKAAHSGNDISFESGEGFN